MRKSQPSLFESGLGHLQDYTLMVWDMLRNIGSAWKYRKEVLKEMYYIGAQSFPIVFLSGLFIGIILAIEVGHRFELFGAKTMVGRTVSLGMIRELGPVISGLLLAARTGAKNASELGSMQITEQVDALRAFGISPAGKLVVPRVLASLIMFFPLTAIADLVGITGGALVAQWWINIDFSFFWRSAVFGLERADLIVGFAKPIAFAYFISTISCYYGLATRGGSRALGRSTINAVVASSLTVLLFDFIITKLVWELF